MTPQDLGAKFKELRIAKGLTQKQLGGIVNMPRTAIARAERGLFYPSIETFLKLTEALEATFIVEDGMIRYRE